MLFNSYIFIFAFLPVSFFVYFLLNRTGRRVLAKTFLVLASLFFYSWWNVAYLPIILASMFFNYLVGILLSGDRLTTPSRKKMILIIGITANVALLAYFKYADFLIGNFNALLQTHYPLLHLALPLAISFFTFQQIAYLVDSYRGETGEYDFLNYANFVTFFPQLIAGPIVHHQEMMPQFADPRNKALNYQNIAAGLFVFSIGLFKKVIIADTFAVWATMGFDQMPILNMSEAWLSSLSYTFQLYFDFSGYTDMAIGAALLFNIRLPFNFNSPYKAVSIQDFWRRWHMTLSRFLRDYIYIPLGGNRGGEFRTYSNLLLTFLIGGIWHGAGWTFVFWGFLHGIAIVIHRAWTRLGWKMPLLLAWFLTFNFINITWVFFRAKEWEDATKILHAMFLGEFVAPPFLQEFLRSFSHYAGEAGSWHFGDFAEMRIWIWILGGLVTVLLLKNSNQLLLRFKANLLTALYAAILFLTAAASLHKLSEFLYFNF